MKLSKIYSLKKSKCNEIISFKFPFIDNRYQKTTRRVSESTTPPLGKSETPRLAESGSRWEKKDSIKIFFPHTKVVFYPPKFAKKDNFLPKNIRWIIESLSLKSLDS